nr:hypothetical protein [Pseudomonas sp.]
MTNLMNCLHEGALAPALHTELQEGDQHLQFARETLAHTEASLQKLEALVVAWANERQVVIKEKTILKQQLSQVQAQLEQVYVRSQGEIARLTQEKDAISVARSKELQQLAEMSRELASTRMQLEQTKRESAALAQDKNTLDAAARAHVAEQQSIATEKRELLQRLNVAQQELETLYLDSRQRAATLEQEKSQYAVEKVKSDRKLSEITDVLLIAQAKAEALAKANQQLTDELREQRKVLVDSEHQAKAHARTLTEQNSLLQSQLYQIQAELEQYYLANREMQAVMANSAQAMHRARGALTKTLLHD